MLEAFESSINIKEEFLDDYTVLEIENKKHVDLNKLDPKEIYVLESVNEKFKSFGSRKIMNYMQNEDAYMSTNDYQVMPYSLVSKIEI